MLPARPTGACVRYVFELGHEAYAARAWETAIDRWALVCSLALAMGLPQPETCEQFVARAADAGEAGDMPRAARCALVAATNALEQLGMHRIEDPRLHEAHRSRE